MLRALLPRPLSDALFARVDAGLIGSGVTAADARVLGKAYVKQVDVVMAQWARGPELLISTKRMDSSFGNNALNRIEESYGDAKNLRGRYPLAATGFLLVLRSTAFVSARDTALRLLDLMIKLGREDDGYDACSVIVAEWSDPAPAPPFNDAGDRRPVTIRQDLVPEDLRIERFLDVLVKAILDRTPVDIHVEARRRIGAASTSTESTTGAVDSGPSSEPDEPGV